MDSLIKNAIGQTQQNFKSDLLNDERPSVVQPTTELQHNIWTRWMLLNCTDTV